MRGLLPLAVVAAVLAAGPGPAAGDDQIDFDLPAGPLQVTLIQIGRSAGIYMSFRPELVLSRQAPAIKGRLTAMQAATQALADSGLTIETVVAGVLTVRPAPTEPPASPFRAPATPPADPVTSTLTLPRVEITGSAQPQQIGLQAVRGWSATRDDTPLAELPQAVSVLTPLAMDLQGGDSSSAALSYVAGLQEILDVLGSGARFVPAYQVRGFAAAYALSGMSTSRRAIPLDNAFVERIEVPKGPSGVVAGMAGLGSAAVSELGGLINLVRKQPDPAAPRVLNQTFDSIDGGTVRFTGDTGGTARGGTLWRLVGHASQSGRTEGGYERRGAAGLLGSAAWQHGDLAAAVTVQLDGGRSVPAPAGRGGIRLQDDGSLAIVPLEPGVADPANPQDRIVARGADIDLDLTWRLAPRWQIALRSRAEALRNDWRRNELLFRPLVVSDKAQLQVVQFGLSGEVSTGAAAHRLLLGLDVQRSRQTTLDQAATGALLDDTRELRQLLLLQDQIRLGRWRIRLGLQRARPPRLSVISNNRRFDVGAPGGTNGDLGLLYQLGSDSAVYGGLQSTIEAGQYLASDLVLADGSPRPPARMTQAQAGLRFGLPDSRLTLSAEVFRMQKLDRAIGTAEGFVARPGRYVSGLELELSGRPRPGLDISVGYAGMRARDTIYGGMTPADLFSFQSDTAGVPRHSLHLLARLQMPQQLMPNTALGLGLRASSDILVGIPDAFLGLGLRTEPYVLPGGGQLDVSLERQLGPWAIKGFVHNLTDQRLYTPTYEVTYLPLRPARHFGLSLTYTD